MTLPSAGLWTGKRIGPGERLGDALQLVEINTNTASGMKLMVTLPPRQAVQYILTPPSTIKP
ncbi:MAG: hypothetical protein HC898_09325 [Phycisphaerales bacterium]|nr:hypothetical protein [Phycisphaerales bacterium]